MLVSGSLSRCDWWCLWPSSSRTVCSFTCPFKSLSHGSGSASPARWRVKSAMPACALVWLSSLVSGGLFFCLHSVADDNFGELYLLFSRSSYFGRDRTKIGRRDIAGRQRQLFDARVDLSAAHRNHHFLSAQFGPIQLGALEGHCDHGVWHRRLYIRLVCKYARYCASTAAIGRPAWLCIFAAALKCTWIIQGHTPNCTCSTCAGVAQLWGRWQDV